jgi:hypothetical protein
MSFRTVASLAMAILATSAATPVLAAGEALALAQRPAIAGQFKAALLDAAFRTTTVQTAFSICGEDQFKAIVVGGLEKAAAATQAEWNAANAEVMDRLLPQDRLAASSGMSDAEVGDMLASVDRSKLAAEYEATLQPILTTAVKLAVDDIFNAISETCKQ